MKEYIDNWFQRLNCNEKIPSDIIALNFGLFKIDKGYCIYLIGSKHYVEDDDDWACDNDFEPEEKYLKITSDTIGNMSWYKFQLNVIQIITDYISANLNKQSIVFNKIVTVGFDDGKLVRCIPYYQG